MSPDISQLSLELQLPILFQLILRPPMAAVEPIGESAWIGCEAGDLVALGCQLVAGERQQTSTKAPALKRRVDEQGSDRSVAVFGGRETGNAAPLFDNPKQAALDEVLTIRPGNRIGVGQAVFLHGKADFHQAGNVLNGGASCFCHLD
jgi:hypothetical protein